MGYFFRRSTSFGPFRLNFSKSGIGASFGVPGARITMNPSGTTYITVGTHGIYYRETVAGGNGCSQDRLPSQPPLSPASEEPSEIHTASADNLVDSSSEELVRNLNERAEMFNPAWLLYVAALITLLVGLGLRTTDSPLASDATVNRTDSYVAIVARYGYPNSAAAESIGNVPTRTATYSAANLRILLVPEGCTEAFQADAEVLEDRERSPAIAKQEIKELHACSAGADTNWNAVAYIASEDNGSISYESAKLRLDRITTRLSLPPVLESADRPAKMKAAPSDLTRKHITPAKQAWSVPEGILAQIRTAEQRAVAAQGKDTTLSYLLTIGSIAFFVAGIVAHKNNTAKRTTRLFYELDEKESSRYSVIQQAANHLSHANQVWRIEADSPTSDWKRNAGASSSVRRVSSQVGYADPPRVESNVRVPYVALGQSRLYFMPDLC